MVEVGNYKICKKLGEGGFGKVFLVEEKSDPSKKHALKIMEMGKMDAKEKTLALQEIQLLASLDHKYVLSYVTCFTEDRLLCIVTEFCPNGDLSDYIKKQLGSRLEEDRLIEWFRQIASAVEYLHSKNIIHRDLKVQNVFLDVNMNCKLGDLGIARILDSASDLAITKIGTVHYMSPEMFLGIPYNYKTDIWSLAVVMYELATLEKPFEAKYIDELIYKVTRGKKPDMPTGYRPEFGTLLSKMMEKLPKNRPSAAEIMNDGLFKKARRPGPMQGLRSPDEYGSSDCDFGALDMKTILQTVSDLCGPGKKDKTFVTGPGRDEAATDLASTGKPDYVMKLVTRKLTDMGHNTVKPVGVGNIDHQIKMLKMYILNVLDNDKKLFDVADKELDKMDEKESLEEKLIHVLGHERYGMCGVELLYYKNFTYNQKQANK